MKDKTKIIIYVEFLLITMIIDLFAAVINTYFGNLLLGIFNSVLFWIFFFHLFIIIIVIIDELDDDYEF